MPCAWRAVAGPLKRMEGPGGHPQLQRVGAVGDGTLSSKAEGPLRVSERQANASGHGTGAPEAPKTRFQCIACERWCPGTDSRQPPKTLQEVLLGRKMIQERNAATPCNFKMSSDVEIILRCQSRGPPLPPKSLQQIAGGGGGGGAAESNPFALPPRAPPPHGLLVHKRLEVGKASGVPTTEGCINPPPPEVESPSTPTQPALS